MSEVLNVELSLDGVNNLQSQTGDVVEHKKTVAFAVEPTKELMETSSSQVIHSQDVTLDFYEGLLTNRLFTPLKFNHVRYLNFNHYHFDQIVIKLPRGDST